MTRKKLIHWRRGSRRRKPSLRIGGRAGVNVSSTGVHFTVHKKRRSRAKRSGCGKAAAGSILLVLLLGLAVWGVLHSARPT
ncbi:MAG TPA: hypothetical protein VM366_13845 [Anaerolineae bacterium]|nr:hypothetical protein [Anaerolineae bacterium]